MKKKLLIIAVILLLIIILAIVINSKTTKNEQTVSLNNNENLIAEISKEKDLPEQEDNIIDDDEKNLEDENTIIEENTIDQQTQEIIEQPQETEKVEIPRSEQKKVTTSSSNYSNSSLPNPSVQENEPLPESEAEPETSPQVEVSSVSEVEEIPQENVEIPNNTQPVQKNTPYWCVDGGTHHVEGDAPNEHGYYSSWDEAYRAYEEYTKDWTSSYNYKIDSCACGQYYFWVQQ